MSCWSMYSCWMHGLLRVEIKFEILLSSLTSSCFPFRKSRLQQIPIQMAKDSTRDIIVYEKTRKIRPRFLEFAHHNLYYWINSKNVGEISCRTTLEVLKKHSFPSLFCQAHLFTPFKRQHALHFVYSLGRPRNDVGRMGTTSPNG